MGAAIGLGMVVLAANPAYAMAEATGQTILPKQSVSAPLGARALCQRYDWACAPSAQGAVTEAQAMLELADRINQSINRGVREITDQRQYQRQDHWALPTLEGGDCEDFALLKKRELIRAGIAPDRLRIATVLDQAHQAHAVLILRTPRGDYVLDNLTDQIKPWDQTGYAFLRMQDPRVASGWSLILMGGIFG